MTDERNINDPEVVGTTTTPGDNYLDKVQADVLASGVGPGGEHMDVGGSAQDAVSVDTSWDESVDVEPQQVEDTTVIYVPRKDFEARVNQDIFPFRAGIPTRVTRDIANMLLEDEERGYVKE